MCGRVRCSLRVDDIPRACHLSNTAVRAIHTDRYNPAYNVPPGSYLPVVRRGDGSDGQGPVIHCMKWGLIPSFTKKTEKPDHYKMFNARSESICEKASFRRLLSKNRCLVTAEGFYEWKKDKSKKQPYYIHFKDSRPLVFAALYDCWEDCNGEVIYTYTILTTSSSSALKWLHDRMPVVLGDKAKVDAWLGGSSEFDVLLKPYEEPDLGWYAVTPAMGSTSFSTIDCIKEVRLKTEAKHSIENFFSRTSAQKSNFQAEDYSVEGSLKTHEQENLKVDPDSEDSMEYLFSPGKDGDNSKPSVSLIPREMNQKLPIKRDHEELSDISEPIDVKGNMQRASPAKKKSNLSAGDKQPTLFSFFEKR